jgi:hypothetical protein
VLWGISVEEKVQVSPFRIETRAIPLHIVLAIAVIFPFGAFFIYYFLTHPVVFQERGFTVGATAMTIALLALFFVGVISLFFSKMEIDDEGVTIRTPWVRMVRYRAFPFHLRFDEIRIKPVWDGRILVIVRAEQLDWLKRIVWSTAILGGYWVMPFKWKESLEIIENLQNAGAA